ncbi:MAG: hypothetical protein EPN14_01300 [Gallionella sp.]|nr:MAG: hypothetical protein EPN14_01300 [Gallionella sp.]
MATFTKLKKIKSVLNQIPGIKTYKDFDILIEIGFHQELGTPLTLKQLSLLGITSDATVRRYLSRLVREGMVEKFESSGDRRYVILQLSASTIRMLTDHLSRLTEHLAKHEASSKPRKN